MRGCTMAIGGFHKERNHQEMGPKHVCNVREFSRERLGSAVAGVLRAAAEPALACPALTRAFGERGRRSRASCLSHRRPL